MAAERQPKSVKLFALRESVKLPELFDCFAVWLF